MHVPTPRLTALASLLTALALGGCSYHYHQTGAATTTSAAVVVEGEGYVAHEVFYRDPHPVHVVDASVEDWCGVEGPHAHHYEPEHVDFYVVDGDGYYMFNGDPTYYVESASFELYGYHGHHPFILDGTWCYADALHYHHYAPVWYHRYGWYDHYYMYHGHYDAWYHSGHTVYLGRYYDHHTPRRVSWRRTHRARPHHRDTGGGGGGDDHGGTVTAARPDTASGDAASPSGGVVQAPVPADSGSRGAGRSAAADATLEGFDRPLDAEPLPAVRGDEVATMPPRAPVDLESAPPMREVEASPGRRGPVILDDGTGSAGRADGHLPEPARATGSDVRRRELEPATTGRSSTLRSDLEPRGSRTRSATPDTPTTKRRDPVRVDTTPSAPTPRARTNTTTRRRDTTATSRRTSTAPRADKTTTTTPRVDKKKAKTPRRRSTTATAPRNTARSSAPASSSTTPKKKKDAKKKSKKKSSAKSKKSSAKARRPR